MTQVPQIIRTTIAQNIRRHRLQKYPGRGGAKACAAAFGVSPQQWSPWERGVRTPSEPYLRRLAEFFDTTVEELSQPLFLDETIQPEQLPDQEERYFKAIISQKMSNSSPMPASLPEFLLNSHNAGTKAVFVVQVEMVVTEVRYETIQREGRGRA